MTRYTIFGQGRVGANMASYLEHLGHDVSLISRTQAETMRRECAQLIDNAEIIAAAIPDDRLQPWHDEWRDEIRAKTAVHFSGAVSIDGMVGFHPLYSFPKSLLSVGAMEQIAFACPSGGASFGDVFPRAPNPHFEIADGDRARYHALAVLSGNLASYLWNETAKELAVYTGMPPEKIMASYLGSILEGFVENPTSSLTGPIARHDNATVDKNLASLTGDPKLKGLYEAFLAAAWPDYDVIEKS